MAPRRSNKTGVRSQVRRISSASEPRVPAADIEALYMCNPDDLNLAVAFAEHCNNHGQERRILEILEPFAARYPFPDQMLRGSYNRLLAFGYGHTGKFAEAEKVIERGIIDFPESLDFYYALCFVKLSLREYEAALSAGHRFIELRYACESGEPRPFCLLKNQLSQVYNFMGSACLQDRNLATARVLFELATFADPGNHLPYLNLATIYSREGRHPAAREIIDLGLKQCRQVHELTMTAESLKRTATVSACLIVKNEEEMLSGCLESIRDWVDEIIVVDTGSTDKTMEIARSYGAKVYEHPWEGSFSKARNQSLGYATKDWVFIIDADERVYTEDIPHIIQALARGDADVLTVDIYNLYKEFEDTVVFLPSHRFFRRALGLAYDGIVHNQLRIPNSVRIVRTGIRMKHFGYGLTPEKMEAKARRTRALLEEQLADDPDNAFALFNYAQLLRTSPDGFKPEHAPLVIRAASRAVELADPYAKQTRHIHLMCLDQLAWTHHFLGDETKALEYADRALRLKPDYLDPLLLRGYCYSQLGDYDQAAQAFERYLVVHRKYDPSRETESIILIHLNARAEALFNLGVIAEIRQDWPAAAEYYRQTLAINPRYHLANGNYARVLMRQNDLSEAGKFFRRQVELGKHTDEARLGLAHIHIVKEEWLQAEKIYRDILRTDPDSIGALAGLGEMHMRSGQPSQASELLRRAFNLQPAHLPLARTLTELLIADGRHAEAIEVFSRLERHVPLPAELCNDFANCYYRLQQFEAAERYYQRAYDLDESLLAALRNLGLTKARLDKSAEAIDLLTRYLELDPGQVDIYHVVGDLLIEQEKFSAALAFYERYLLRRPNDPTALVRLGDCYLHLGHQDSAVVGYRRAVEIEPNFLPAQHRLASLAPVTPAP